MRFLMVLLALVLAGCSDAPEGNEPPAFRNFVETGDLDALRERGVVRLLAPRFDDDPALPRDGLPMARYQELAEHFVRVLGLEPQWIRVDDYGALIDALEDGRGDIIVTNLSHTRSRAERVAFTVPVQVVDEVLVLPEALAGATLDSLGALQLAVPADTAYAETAARLAEDNDAITVQLLPGDVPDAEQIDGVAAGQWPATILDSNLADALLPHAVGVVRGPVVRADREIAWALRPQSTELRRRLNEFITATEISRSRQQRQLRSWNDIKQSGVLRVITGNSAVSYFLWRGELMGFDYELIRLFAEQHGLRVSVVVRDGPEAQYQALQAGYGDVIAASLTRTPEREQRGWQFSRPYLKITEQVLARTDTPLLSSPSALAGKTVVANPQHSYMETLLALQEQGTAVRIKPVPGAPSELLVNAVANGEYDYTVADSHLAALEEVLRDDVHVVLDLGDEKSVAWVTRDDQRALQDKLDGFIRKAYRGLDYNLLFNRYFREPSQMARHQAFRVEPGKPVSPYDELVRELAQDTDFDWRLLIAQMYQESRFNPEARSFAGAVGLMQVLPRTARQFDIHGDLTDPETNIRAGLEFLQWLEHRFPARLPLDERIYFSLAAYNAGHGHVQDARRLARQLGKNPDLWFGHVEQAMLLLSKPEYASKARYGYVRGTEPVRYVREIRERYVGYLHAKGATAD